VLCELEEIARDALDTRQNACFFQRRTGSPKRQFRRSRAGHPVQQPSVVNDAP
jgi:hypothetical protein